MGAVSELENENKELKAEHMSLRNEVIDSKQYSRRNSVEINDVTLCTNEDIVRISVDLAQKVEVVLSVSHLDAVYRIPTKDKDKPNIILKFFSRYLRDQFVYHARKVGNLTSDVSKQHMFVNDHLCL